MMIMMIMMIMMAWAMMLPAKQTLSPRNESYFRREVWKHGKGKGESRKAEKVEKWTGLGSDLWAASHCKASVSHKHQY